MKTSLAIFALALFGALISVPANACPGSKHYSSYSNDRHAVAGYSDNMRDDYLDMKGGAGYGRSTAEVDAARIAEYKSIFSGSGYAVAGYNSSWSPWYDGGTWVNVNGQRVWATRDDFVWMDDHWVWMDDNDAYVTFEDTRFNVDAQDWGINDIKVDSDRFDLDVDRDKLDLDTDMFEVPDKLEIK